MTCISKFFFVCNNQSGARMRSDPPVHANKKHRSGVTEDLTHIDNLNILPAGAVRSRKQIERYVDTEEWQREYIDLVAQDVGSQEYEAFVEDTDMDHEYNSDASSQRDTPDHDTDYDPSFDNEDAEEYGTVEGGAYDPPPDGDVVVRRKKRRRLDVDGVRLDRTGDAAAAATASTLKPHKKFHVNISEETVSHRPAKKRRASLSDESANNDPTIKHRKRSDSGEEPPCSEYIERDGSKKKRRVPLSDKPTNHAADIKHRKRPDSIVETPLSVDTARDVPKRKHRASLSDESIINVADVKRRKRSHSDEDRGSHGHSVNRGR